MAAQNVGERLRSQRPRVAFVNVPRGQQNACDRGHRLWIIAECQTSPLVRDRGNTLIWIPSQPRVTIKVRHGQRAPQPVLIHPDIHYSDKSSQRTVEGLSGNDVFHWTVRAVGMQIEIKD